MSKKQITPTDRTSRLGGYVYQAVEIYRPTGELERKVYGLGLPTRLPRWVILPACPRFEAGRRNYPN